MWIICFVSFLLDYAHLAKFFTNPRALFDRQPYHTPIIEQEKLKLQSKELKDAVSQRKLAMSEYTEVTDKLSELRQQKQKLSRTVRDKEEVVLK